MASAKKSLFFLVFIPDVILFYAGLFIAIFLRYPQGPGRAETLVHLKVFSYIFLLWLLVFFIHGLFEAASFRRYSSLMFKLVSAMLVNFLVAISYFYFQPNLILTPRRVLIIDITATFALLLLWHLLIKYLIKNRMTEAVYLFAFDRGLDDLAREIRQHAYLGYRLAGEFNGQNLPTGGVEKNSLIVLPDNLNSSPGVSQALYRLRTNGVSFSNHKDFYEDLTRRVYLSELSELWFLENIDYQEKRFYNLLKRAVDILAGLAGLLVFLVSLPFVWLAIKFTDRGPIFFVQARVGKGGEIFKVYKYRTMSSWGATNTWTSANDPRITRAGKFLRKSRVDEWPQFINLILGHMSLVGPRPEQPHIVEELKKQIPFYDERHLVKPGLTGWAQINNIYAASLEETKLKLQYDLYYIKYRGFIFDLEIILKTIYYIFTWQGR